MTIGTCQGCGKKILWGITPEGKSIPLDPSAPVYTVVTKIPGTPRVKLLPASERRELGPWVSHFATCPKASQFSGSSKSAAPQGG